MAPDHETFYQYLYDSPVPCDFVPVDGGKNAMPIEVYRELIRGRIFINRNKQKVCIGMTKEVGEILGLEYQAWQNMENSLAETISGKFRMGHDLTMVIHQLDEIKRASWWVRLKWLFTGVR